MYTTFKMIWIFFCTYIPLYILQLYYTVICANDILRHQLILTIVKHVLFRAKLCLSAKIVPFENNHNLFKRNSTSTTHLKTSMEIFQIVFKENIPRLKLKLETYLYVIYGCNTPVLHGVRCLLELLLVWCYVNQFGLLAPPPPASNRRRTTWLWAFLETMVCVLSTYVI